MEGRDVNSPVFESPREVEHHGAVVARLYKAAFDRTPDQDGLRDFVGMLREGEPTVAIALHLTGSAEFLKAHGEGAPDLAYIRRLYRNITGREPDDTDIAGLVALAASGETRAGLLAATAGPEMAHVRIDLRQAKPGRARPDDELAYQLWLAEYPELTDADRAGIHDHIAEMRAPPALTLLMAAPRYRVDLALETIASVRRQLYPRVDLRIAVPADTTPATREALTRAARQTAGITLVHAGPGATGLINAAFARCDGVFAGILEAGDQLAPDAMYLVAAAIEATPDAVVIYGDEDRIDGGGARYAPIFKTGWNPDLLLAGDAIGQLAMIRADRWRAKGGMRADVAQYGRFDLVLRVLGKTENATHVPSILFHRGRGGRKSAPDFPDATATSRHPELLGVVRANMAHTGSSALLDEAIVGGKFWPRVRFPVPAPPPLVSVLIPIRDGADLLENCLDGVLGGTDYPSLEILILDNGSVETATRQVLVEAGRDDRVRVLRFPGPFNYSAMNNAAAREARGDVLLLLNNDIAVIEPGWLAEMVGHAMRSDVGAVGAKLLYPTGNLQHAGLMLGPDGGAKHILRWATGDATGYLGQLALTRDVAAVTGACLAIRRTVFDEVGGLDEDNLQVTWNDIDLCLRVRAHGYRVVWTPNAVLTHVELATRGSEVQSPETLARFHREKDYMLARWGAAFDRDPYQNPGLLAMDDDLVLAAPPRRPRAWAVRAEST